MFNVRPDRRLFGFHVEPPEEVVPGFRINADGSIRKATIPAAPLYSDFNSPFGFRPDLDTNAFTPVGDGMPPPYLTFAVRRFLDGLGGAPRLPTGLTSSAGPQSWPAFFSNTPEVIAPSGPRSGRDRDIQQASLTDRPSETQQERETRIFKVPIPRPDIPIPPPYPPPFYVPILPIIPLPEPDPRPPEAPPPAPGNRIALPST
jgi:hypothetical protein